ncbi:hypothetical protein Malapachy_2187 [Malassezia pachydermatis]|uniref:Uncharacterized protein n=1 Tax=Malassezia pachydermatis TaxID=77020 RepID=A0A0M8MS79_9BASI|nr:hypothetical protein Malapachy_2187 [Malassezia pachydermatis]KOS15717.1 hypothetical protein Malapachy_2187 [Malassezia pachydermatis]
MGRSAKFYKKSTSKKRSSTSERVSGKQEVGKKSSSALHPSEAQGRSAAANAASTAAPRKGGMRAKARRVDGPLPAEAGIDYVGLWEGASDR